MNEDALIAFMPTVFANSDPSVRIGSGTDDCALVELDGRLVAISTDAFVEGSHFLPDALPRDIARKALAASLSDLAASACRARWVVVSACVRKGLPDSWAREFVEELAAGAREYGVTVVGGDTVSSDRGIFISTTVFGEPLAGGPVLRKGARTDDVLIVTGEFGGSLLGRHLRPVPRLREMRFLMDFCAANGGAFPSASMDVSDGLALDLSRLCRESGKGAVVEADAVPIAAAARDMAVASGKRPLDHALSDGEDFELLIAVPPRVWERLQTFLASPAGKRETSDLAPFTSIGTITDGNKLFLRSAGGVLAPLALEGYQHQW